MDSTEKLSLFTDDGFTFDCNNKRLKIYKILGDGFGEDIWKHLRTLK